MSWRGFLSKVFGRNANEDETRILSNIEIGTERLGGKELEGEQQPRSITVERAAEIIDGLPPDVPRASALRIVRRTLAVAGIEVKDIERATRTRESKLHSEIEIARGRQEDLRRRTEEVVRSLEDEMRKAREARDIGIAEEEERISHALTGLKETKRVRTFFDFPEGAEEQTADLTSDPIEDETQVLKRFDANKKQATQRSGPLADTNKLAGGSSTYDVPYGTPDER